MTDREALIEIVTWELRQNPSAREWGALNAEATGRVDAFLKDGALPAQGRRKREKGDDE